MQLRSQVQKLQREQETQNEQLDKHELGIKNLNIPINKHKDQIDDIYNKLAKLRFNTDNTAENPTLASPSGPKDAGSRSKNDGDIVEEKIQNIAEDVQELVDRVSVLEERDDKQDINIKQAFKQSDDLRKTIGNFAVKINQLTDRQDQDTLKGNSRHGSPELKKQVTNIIPISGDNNDEIFKRLSELNAQIQQLKD